MDFTEFHGNGRFSRKTAKFTENVTAVKSWIRLVPSDYLRQVVQCGHSGTGQLSVSPWICMYVLICVCSRDKSKTVEPSITKFGKHDVLRLILGPKSERSTSHRSQGIQTTFWVHVCAIPLAHLSTSTRWLRHMTVQQCWAWIWVFHCMTCLVLDLLSCLLSFT